MSDPKAVSRFRKNRKALLVKVMGSKCSLCGYYKCIGALEFHHIIPEDKSFQLSSGNCHSLEKDLQEAKKCILVCANCHREIHTSNLYEDFDLWKYQIYDKTVAFSFLNKEQKELVCSECGIPITRFSKSGKCPSCVQKGRKKKIIHPDRETLKILIRTLPFTTIVSQYNCSDNAVRKWCDKEGLPRKKSDIVKYTDDEWSKI